MPYFLLYLIKVSVSLTLVYLFYQWVLRRLTFYNWNRFFLLLYSGLSFFIPVVNIMPVLEKNEMTENSLIRFIPAVGKGHDILTAAAGAGTGFKMNTSWDWIVLIVVTGMGILLVRLLIRILSFRNIISRAELISAQDVKLYQVDQPVIPFSFGNSIFINRHLHRTEELGEIIRHEFVHVKQKHTTDIIWSELICLVNWYNPFVWLLRRAIRQNLEFIADENMLQAGINKKQYQYLLLKVIGSNHFSIASQFNFTSLKKRIAMMNKMKSAQMHIVKFLFALPLAALLLVAFRNNQINRQKPALKNNYQQTTGWPAGDTIPVTIKQDTIGIPDIPNNKGYSIRLMETKGLYRVRVRNRNQTEVENVLLDDWNKKKQYYENRYGEIPPVIHPYESIDSAVTFSAIPLKSMDTNAEITVAGKPGTVKSNTIGTTVSTSGKELKPITVTGHKSADAGPNTIGTTVSTSGNDLKPVTVTGYKSSDAGSNTIGTTVSTSGNDLKSITVTGHKTAAADELELVKSEAIFEVKEDMTEEQVNHEVADLNASGYEFKISRMETRNGKLVLIDGLVNRNGRKKHFTASGFFRFIISDVTGSNGKKEFNVNISNGSLVWE